MAETTMNKTTKPTLPQSVFGVKVENHELLKLAYDSYLAGGRSVSATTKRRGEVSGGGKKPWKQKGTGRARFGSSRNPIWRGGGIVFGPLGIENYTKRITTRSKRTALRQALSLASDANKVSVGALTTTGKTKEVVESLKKAKLGTTRRVLVVVDEKTPELLRGSKNVPNVEVIRAQYLSVFHILNADHILVSKPALTVIEKWLGEDK